MKLRDYASLQDQQEYLWYTKLALDLGVKRYLEIGSYVGDTFYSVLANAPKESLGVSIDLDSSKIKDTVEELSTLGYNLKIIQGDSKSNEVLTYVREYGPYDLILIDGDHTYEGVSQDWDNLHQLAPVIAIHDVCGLENEYTKDVYRFWQELKLTQRTIEINFANNQLGYGVVYR